MGFLSSLDFCGSSCVFGRLEFCLGGGFDLLIFQRFYPCSSCGVNTGLLGSNSCIFCGSALCLCGGDRIRFFRRFDLGGSGDCAFRFLGGFGLSGFAKSNFFRSF